MKPEIMLAIPVSLESLQDQTQMWWENRIIEPKIDGVRLIRLKGKWLSRQGKTFYNIEHITSVLDKVGNIDKFLIDGELISDDWSTTVSRIRSFRKGIFDLPGRQLKYMVFDIVPMDNLYMPLRDRKDFMEVFFSKFGEYSFIKPISSYTVSSFSDFKFVYDDYLASGCDGVIIKDRRSPYVLKRSIHWLKVKPHREMDCKIVGFKEGKGKYAKTLGAVLVSIPLPGKSHWSENVTAVSGMEDNERDSIWDNKKKLVGKICEVRYRKVTSDDRMVEPRFVRLRTDKDAD